MCICNIRVLYNSNIRVPYSGNIRVPYLCGYSMSISMHIQHMQWGTSEGCHCASSLCHHDMHACTGEHGAAIGWSGERPSAEAEKGHWQKRRGNGKGLRREQFAAAQPCVWVGRTPARDACAAPGERAPIIGWARWRTCKCKPSRSTHTSAAGPGRSWRCPARAWLRPG